MKRIGEHTEVGREAYPALDTLLDRFYAHTRLSSVDEKDLMLDRVGGLSLQEIANRWNEKTSPSNRWTKQAVDRVCKKVLLTLQDYIIPQYKTLVKDLLAGKTVNTQINNLRLLGAMADQLHNPKFRILYPVCECGCWQHDAHKYHARIVSYRHKRVCRFCGIARTTEEYEAIKRRLTAKEVLVFGFHENAFKMPHKYEPPT